MLFIRTKHNKFVFVPLLLCFSWWAKHCSQSSGFCPEPLSCHFVMFWLFSWSCLIAQNSLVPDTGNGFLLLKGILGEGKTDEERMDEWPEEMTAVCISDDILCWSETMTDRVMLMLVVRRQRHLSGLFFCFLNCRDLCCRRIWRYEQKRTAVDHF